MPFLDPLSAAAAPALSGSEHQEVFLEAAHPSQGHGKVSPLITCGVGLKLAISKPQFTCLAGESTGTNKAEVVLDGGEINAVAFCAVEVKDQVLVAGGAGVAQIQEQETIGAATSRDRVGAGSACDQIVAITTNEEVIATAAVELVVAIASCGG